MCETHWRNKQAGPAWLQLSSLLDMLFLVSRFLRPPEAMFVLVFVGLLVRLSESLLVLVPVLELVPLLEMEGRLELVIPGTGAWWSAHLR